MDGAVLFTCANFPDSETQACILEALTRQKILLLMRDMAAAESGVSKLDGDAMTK